MSALFSLELIKYRAMPGTYAKHEAFDDCIRPVYPANLTRKLKALTIKDEGHPSTS